MAKKPSRSFFAKLANYAKKRPGMTALVIAGIVGCMAIATVATGGMALGIIGLGGLAITTAAGLGMGYFAYAGVSLVDSFDKKETQLNTGNPGGKFVEDYLIIEERRFGKSFNSNHNQTRRNYISLREGLEKQLQQATVTDKQKIASMINELLIIK